MEVADFAARTVGPSEATITSTLAGDDISGECRQPIPASLRPAIFGCHVLALDITGFAEASAESGHLQLFSAGRTAAKEADHPHRLLLRTRRQRPRRRAAEKRDELAPFHSITSSARASKVAGRSIVNDLAVLRLMRR